MKIKDLPRPVTASKADWLPGTTWIGFTPSGGDLASRNKCVATIQRQFGDGYIIEYVTERFDNPNPEFDNDPGYLAEVREHEDRAGRFLAIHRLRYSARKLIEIIGEEDYAHLQDMWAQGGKRWRWSVAFPIIESYEIIARPKAKDVLGDDSYRRLFAHSSATLRPLNDEERAALADLGLQPKQASNARIAIEDEFLPAELKEIPSRVTRLIQCDLSQNALEGWEEESRSRVRRRAAWLASKFILGRVKRDDLKCDHCGFDPSSIFPERRREQRGLLDVHHKCPLQEGARYTTLDDFALLCPTCHRIEHARMRLDRREEASEPQEDKAAAGT